MGAYKDPGALRCDLHTHSRFSDGTCTPTEIVAEAGRLGLIVALTDHNTAAGLPEFAEAARELGVTAVPGVELTTEHEKIELHLLGLFVQPEHYPVLEEMVAEQMALKEQANRQLVERLNQAGHRIDFEQVKARHPNGTPNRAHVAAELVERGCVASVQEAFDTLLDESCGFYRPPAQLPILDTIRALRRIGVLPVLAHPLQELTAEQLRRFLPAAVEAGLAGMETVHSSYSPETIRLAGTIAGEFGLLPSGGSDFHGTIKPKVALGAGTGQCGSIGPEVYEALLAAWKGLQA